MVVPTLAALALVDRSGDGRRHCKGELVDSPMREGREGYLLVLVVLFRGVWCLVFVGIGV